MQSIEPAHNQSQCFFHPGDCSAEISFLHVRDSTAMHRFGELSGFVALSGSVKFDASANGEHFSTLPWF
jgi:hypothetical protein